ncbi:MAG: type IV pilin protein [Steroidobacteraceae bacterium]|jgi:type IV pilus assembly protein PilE
MKAAMSNNQGFSLIELMITVAIVAILAAIAIPSYSAFTQRSNRTDATRTLTFDAQALERCYSQTFSYSPCAGVTIGTSASPQGYYSVVVAVQANPAAFTITATAVNAPQTSDSACQTFTVNSSGTQGALNSASAPNTQTCWGST